MEQYNNSYDESIPIKTRLPPSQINNQNILQQRQQQQFQQYQPQSMAIAEKTRLPPQSNVYMNYSRIMASNQNQNFQNQNGYVQSRPINLSAVQPQEIVQQRNDIQPVSQKIEIPAVSQKPKSRAAEHLQCKYCCAEITTEVEFEIGVQTFLLAIILTFCVFGFCVLFCRKFRDAVHYCPNCFSQLGKVSFLFC